MIEKIHCGRGNNVHFIFGLFWVKFSFGGKMKTYQGIYGLDLACPWGGGFSIEFLVTVVKSGFVV